MIDKKQICIIAWRYIRLGNCKSEAFKKAWQDIKIKNSMELEYKNNLPAIRKICYLVGHYYKVNYKDLLSYSNEIFIEIYNKYNYNKVEFNKYLQIQLNNYLRMYCKQIYKRKHEEEIIRYRSESVTEIKLKEYKRLSKLSNEIVNYCITENAKSRQLEHKVKSKDKIYVYKKENKKISMRKIAGYFRTIGYSFNDIKNAFDEIKFVLREELI